jgi:predicted DNA-binding transcriptional regulator AlpA
MSHQKDSFNEALLWKRSDLQRLRIRFTREELHEMERRGEFPKRVILESGFEGWVPAEVRAWLVKRINARPAQPQQDAEGNGNV